MSQTRLAQETHLRLQMTYSSFRLEKQNRKQRKAKINFKKGRNLTLGICKAPSQLVESKHGFPLFEVERWVFQKLEPLKTGLTAPWTPGENSWTAEGIEATPLSSGSEEQFLNMIFKIYLYDNKLILFFSQAGSASWMWEFLHRYGTNLIPVDFSGLGIQSQRWRSLAAMGQELVRFTECDWDLSKRNTTVELCHP